MIRKTIWCPWVAGLDYDTWLLGGVWTLLWMATCTNWGNVQANLPKEDSQKRKTQPTEHPSTRMVIVHQLDPTLTQQHDIWALIKDVKHLKEENLQLTAEVAELKKSFGTPASSSPIPLHTLHHASRVEDTTVTQTNDIIAQAINTLPKTLESFWKQMKKTICSASFNTSREI